MRVKSRSRVHYVTTNPLLRIGCFLTLLGFPKLGVNENNLKGLPWE